MLLDDTFEVCVDSSSPQVRRTMTVPDPHAAREFLRGLLLADEWTPVLPTSEQSLAMERELDGWDAAIVLHTEGGRLVLDGTVGNGDYEPGCLG